MKNYTLVVSEKIATEDEYDDLTASFEMGDGFGYVDGYYDKRTGLAKFALGVSEWGDVNEGVE